MVENASLEANRLDVSKKAEIVTEKFLALDQAINSDLQKQHQKIMAKLEERSRNSFNRSRSINGSILAQASSKVVFPAQNSAASSQRLVPVMNILDQLKPPPCFFRVLPASENR